VSRLRDSQLGDAKVKDIANYMSRPLWEMLRQRNQPVLADRRDRQGDIEFPTTCCANSTRCVLRYETPKHITRDAIIIITSNNEKELPDAFLARCFSTHPLPDPRRCRDRACTSTEEEPAQGAMEVFLRLPNCPLKKKPSTSECSTGSSC